MITNQFLSGLTKCRKVRTQVYKITYIAQKRGIFILSLVAIIFGYGELYAQHLFSINYNDLSQANARHINTQIANSGVSITSLERNVKGDYDIPLMTIQNTKIIILNEETGNNVMIVPTEIAPIQFRLQSFHKIQAPKKTGSNLFFDFFLQSNSS